MVIRVFGNGVRGNSKLIFAALVLVRTKKGLKKGKGRNIWQNFIVSLKGIKTISVLHVRVDGVRNFKAFVTYVDGDGISKVKGFPNCQKVLVGRRKAVF